jgi:cullin-associated NEDD8-dissociated protein 1
MDNEIVEASLITFDSFAKKCPKEITKHIPALLDMVTKLIAYDPNYTYDNDHDMGGGNDEDEGGWGSDWDEDD